MGFLDNVTSAVNRGTAAASRASRSTQLKMQLNDLMKQRRDMCAQLGASLYDATKDNAELRQGREPLFDAIAGVDQQRQNIENEIAALEAQAAQQNVALSYYKCPRCGSTVSGGDLFCSSCGAPIAEIMAAYQQPAQPAQAAPVTAAAPAATPAGPTCAACGAPMNEGDLFCMACGTRAESPEA